MSDALKELIEQDDWLSVAKAITFAHLNAPKNPAKYAWVSAVEEGPYHIETNDSAANGGQGFKAICSAAGDFNWHLTAAQIFPSQKCKSCIEISSKQVLDVAPKGVAGVGGAEVDSDDPNAEALIKRQVGTACKSCPGDRRERGDATSVSDEMAWNRANVEASPADSVISDRHGDNRFADNILRALEGLPQHGDDLEELDAAEEGAAIEASGYQFPEYERN